MTLGSLFAGIGGFDLGFERAGFKTVWQVEIDEYCRRVLERHFPGAERFGDIRECCGSLLRLADGRCAECARRFFLPWVDVIAGGFPCQDVSECGQRIGIDGDRSGLWADMLRIIGELRPRFALVENVTGLLNRGIGRVLGDLAEIGYDCEWQCLSAAGIGLPHLRERIWIVAYPAAQRVAQRGIEISRGQARFAMPPSNVRIADWRKDSYRLRRANDGIPGKLDRGCGLGNAVVPQIAQWIAERIKAVSA